MNIYEDISGRVQEAGLRDGHRVNKSPAPTPTFYYMDGQERTQTSLAMCSFILPCSEFSSQPNVVYVEH